MRVTGLLVPTIAALLAGSAVAQPVEPQPVEPPPAEPPPAEPPPAEPPPAVEPPAEEPPAAALETRDEPVSTEPPAALKPKERKKQQLAGRGWTLEYGGRIFVRDTFTRIDLGADTLRRHDRDIDQARLFASYDRKRLRIAFEIDFAGGEASVKDTFIRLVPDDAVRLQVGRFKVPMSFIGLESKWRLPSTERGVLSELEQDGRDLPFGGGRGDGVSVELRPALALEPRLTLAAFHNPLASEGTGLDPTEDLTQDLHARLEIEPARGLHAAASFAAVGFNDEPGVLASYDHKAMGGLELYLELAMVRLWAEVFAGQSFFYTPAGPASGTFTAARSLLTAEIDRPLTWMRRIDPYLGVSWLEPTDDVDGDRITEVVGGVSLGFTRYWRLQLEAAHRIAEGGASIVADSTLVRIQLGAAFEEIVE